MSLWSKIKEAHRTTIDNVAIQMLQQNYSALVNLVLSLPPERAAESTAKFVALANEVRMHLHNWSEQGALKMAKRISDDASADQHLNRSSAIAKGLVAVWVECHVRRHPVAELIKIDLNNLIESNNARMIPEENHGAGRSPSQDLESFLKELKETQPVNATGYGYVPQNPILCPDILLSKVYLSALRHNGRRVQCERLGSMRVDERVVDIYSVSDSEGYIARIYVDAHGGASARPRIPQGFSLSDPEAELLPASPPPSNLTELSEEKIRELRARPGYVLLKPPTAIGTHGAPPDSCPKCGCSLIKLRSSDMCCPSCGEKWPCV